MSRTPFIKTREVTWCCPNAGYWNRMSPELKDRFFVPRWSTQRLRRHLEMFKAFGFNSIETSAAGQLPMNAGVEDSVWEAKMVLLMQMARDMGMGVTFFKWGSHIFDNAGKCYVGNLDWHDAAEREQLDREYRHQARYARYVDRIVTHWVDPGQPKTGCDKCSIETAIEMHNRIMELSRRENPALEGFFSTWALQWPGWPHWRGYDGVHTLAQSSTLDRNTGIALECSNYASDGSVLDPQARFNAADLDIIAKSGRNSGVWCWYTADIEIQPSLHVHTALLQRYFRHLREKASQGLDWHSMDDCCQGLNMQNLFIAGHLMQDPALDARTLLTEFVAGLVGERVAPAVTAGLDVIEQARCRSLRYAMEVAGAELAPPETNQRPMLDPAWLTDTARRVTDAIARVDRLSISGDQATPWPVTMPPAEYVAELKAHLHAVDQMLSFLRETQVLQQRAAGGASPEEMETAIDALPQVVDDPAHTTGLEVGVCRSKLAALKRLHGRWITEAAASALLPAPGDIRGVPIQPANTDFRAISRLPETGLLDIRPIHGGTRDGLVYVRGALVLQHGGKGRLLYSADGPVKCWVNGRAAGCEPQATNPAVADQYSSEVVWQEGGNEVVFAVHTNAGKAWGVMARATLDG